MGEFTSALQNRLDYTPDFKEIRKKDNILLFVYDEYRESMYGKDMFKKSGYLGRASTCATIFRMYIWQGKWPVVVKNGLMGTRVIIGDVYVVDAATLMQMDAIYKNGEELFRSREYVYLEDQRAKANLIPTQEAVMYLRGKNGVDDEQATWDVSIKETRLKYTRGSANSLPLVQEYDPL